MNETTKLARKEFITLGGDFATLEIDEVKTSTGTRFDAWINYPGLLSAETLLDSSNDLMYLYDLAMSWTENMGWLQSPEVGA